MGDASPRRPWIEGPDEEAPPESWLTLDDDELLHRIETLDAEENEDDRLLEVVASDRHFFIRQEAAKRVRDRTRLFAFEDDRHVGPDPGPAPDPPRGRDVPRAALRPQPARRGALGGPGAARAAVAAPRRARGSTPAVELPPRCPPAAPAPAPRRAPRPEPVTSAALARGGCRRQPARVGRPLRRRAGLVPPGHDGDAGAARRGRGATCSAGTRPSSSSRSRRGRARGREPRRRPAPAARRRGRGRPPG